MKNSNFSLFDRFKKGSTLLVLLAFLLTLLLLYTWDRDSATNHYQVDNSAILEHYASKRSDTIVTGKGTVIKLLADDLKGKRHQKFIVQIDDHHTLLVSHNIDIAPRLDSLKEDDTVLFRGEYEWNSKGGVVHWTHHSTRANHVGGWIIHNGVKFQ